MKITQVQTNGGADRQFVGLLVEPDDSIGGRAPMPLALQQDVREAIIRYLGGYTQADLDRTLACQRFHPDEFCKPGDNHPEQVDRG